MTCTVSASVTAWAISNFLLTTVLLEPDVTGLAKPLGKGQLAI